MQTAGENCKPLLSSRGLEAGISSQATSGTAAKATSGTAHHELHDAQEALRLLGEDNKKSCHGEVMRVGQMSRGTNSCPGFVWWHRNWLGKVLEAIGLQGEGACWVRVLQILSDSTPPCCEWL